MKKYSIATWNGSGLEGSGSLNLQSKILSAAPYTFNSRFNDTTGTNSEELLAAAYATDFTMKLSFILTEAGYPPLELMTTCSVDFDLGRLVSLTLKLSADIAGIEEDLFNEFVDEANKTCPMSHVLTLKAFIDAQLLKKENLLPEYLKNSNVPKEFNDWR